MSDEIHIEIENMDGCKQAHLICNGWDYREVDGDLLWTNRYAFDAVDMCTDNAIKLQKIIDDWGKADE